MVLSVKREDMQINLYGLTLHRAYLSKQDYIHRKRQYTIKHLYNRNKLYGRIKNKSRKISEQMYIHMYIQKGREGGRKGRKVNEALRNQVKFYKELGLELCLKLGRI